MSSIGHYIDAEVGLREISLNAVKNFLYWLRHEKLYDDVGYRHAVVAFHVS